MAVKQNVFWIQPLVLIIALKASVFVFSGRSEVSRESNWSGACVWWRSPERHHSQHWEKWSLYSCVSDVNTCRPTSAREVHKHKHTSIITLQTHYKHKAVLLMTGVYTESFCFSVEWLWVKITLILVSLVCWWILMKHHFSLLKKQRCVYSFTVRCVRSRVWVGVWATDIRSDQTGSSLWSTAQHDCHGV